MGRQEETIGGHRVVRKLGVGGMAETFEAVRTLGGAIEQHVCIKRVLPAYGDDAEYRAMFQREAALATRLRHPNVVAVLDVGLDAEQPYLVLELVDGLDLRALLLTAPHRRLDADVVSYLATELAYALAYAHAPTSDRPAIVHRDVSPSNVLLSRGADVKLADFGLAKAVHGVDATQSGTVRGKIPYLAPEQMRGEPVDGRADLFSLGVLLYECLAGRRPFDGAHEVETMTRILADRREPLLALAPETPTALAELVDRMLAHGRDERPASALHVIAALDALPPPIVARTKLLDLVESRLGGPEARRHLLPKREAEATRAEPPSRTVRLRRTKDVERAEAPEDPPQTNEALATDAPVPPRRRLRGSLVQLGSALTLSALVGGGLAWSQVRRQAARTRDPIEETQPAPRAEPSLAQPTPPEDGGTREESGAIPSDAPVAPAHLRVIVLPWGRVWVDGRPIGRAPLSVELSAGSHRVEAGQDRPTTGRRVRVAAGERRTVELELREGP